MQRTNWFPDPNITGTIKPIANNKVLVEYTVVNNRRLLRAISTAKGDNCAVYVLSGPQLPPSGSYHMHAIAYALTANASFQVFYRVGGSYKRPLDMPVGKDQTVTVDRTITIPAGCDQIRVLIRLDAQTVGAIGMMGDILIERADTYDAAVGGGASGLLHRADRAVLISGRVTADETRESKHVGDQACRQWFRGADGRTDLYRHGGRSAAFASMGQYFARRSDDRHVFRDPHGHVIRRYPDEREESDHRGWRGHHARNEWMVVGRHIARQGRARDHTVPWMVQRRGLAGHASFARRLLLQGHGSILALSLGVAA